MTKPTPDEKPWFTPSRHEDRRPFLLARSRMMKNVRQWFEQEGFLEVDVPALVISPGNETHLHAFSTQLINDDASSAPRYLHTSPEFACKKLLAAGEERIFSLGHVFRNRERTPTHSPEFTMLEWYRANEDYQSIMSDTLALVRLCATKEFSWRKNVCDPFGSAQRLTVNEAFREFAKIDLLKTVDEHGNPIREALASVSPVAFGKDETWSDIFSRILVEKVEPHLGQGQMTLLYEYPSCEAALARRCIHDPRVAERFELYACGVELANGFGELTDPVEQRARFVAEMDEKERRYGERYPIDEDLLRALKLMPPASGVALGFDRLVMLATGATRIDQVVWVPVA